MRTEYDEYLDDGSHEDASRQGHPRVRGRAHDPASQEALVQDDRVAMWLADALEATTARALLRLQSLSDLRRMAIMPDVHPSSDVCVGCVLGTESIVYPQAIGGDIGCGMATVALEGDGSQLPDAESLREVLRRMDRSVPIVMAGTRADDLTSRACVPNSHELRATKIVKVAERDGRLQVGTLGRGNHFVELQRDEAGMLWIMVHSGSRAMGQAVAGHYTTLAQREGVRSSLHGLRLGHASGEDYLADQEWCVRYAIANRRALLERTANCMKSVLGVRARWEMCVDVPHNIVRRERHGGADLLVHRKGAAVAESGRRGLIPGSAGTFSVHVEGRGDARSMSSSSHGAGRIMSRRDAKEHVRAREVAESMRGVVFHDDCLQRLRDESPTAYRDLRVVLEAQRDLVRVTRTLRPLLSFKAG